MGFAEQATCRASYSILRLKEARALLSSTPRCRLVLMFPVAHTQLAKLLTHQLSELQRSEDGGAGGDGGGGGGGNQHAPKQHGSLTSANGTIPEGVEGGETEG